MSPTKLREKLDHGLSPKSIVVPDNTPNHKVILRNFLTKQIIRLIQRQFRGTMQRTLQELRIQARECQILYEILQNGAQNPLLLYPYWPDTNPTQRN
jgi:hypothetical protein